MNKLAIIDIDGMFYHSLRDSFKESLSTFKSKFENLLIQTGATHYVGFYSMGKYFRHKIDSEYKGNRKGRPVAKYYKALKEWAIAEYDFQYMKNVEADDLCAYWMTLKEYEVSSIPELWGGFDKVLCSPDKDLLKSIPGKHFNYTYKLEDKSDPNSVIKGWWVETNKVDSQIFSIEQLLLGDTADNILGCGVRVPKEYKTGPKKGLTYQSREGYKPKQFKEMFERTKGNISAMAIETFVTYVNTFGFVQGIYELQKNTRLLHLLTTDKDYIRENGERPDFPTITSVLPGKEIKEEIIPEF